MRELLDIATSHAFGEEAVQAIFCKNKGNALAEPADEARDHTLAGKRQEGQLEALR